MIVVIFSITLMLELAIKMLVSPVFGLVTFLLATCGAKPSNHIHPLSDEFIELINNNQDLWNAGRNFHESTPRSFLTKLAGTIADDEEDSVYTSATNEIEDDDTFEISEYDKKLPKFFDARLKWPYCTSLYDIRDQGSCGSCWAVAATSAMTDRYCIKYNGWAQFYFSADDLISCCKNECGQLSGCKGGKLWKAWQFAQKTGLVSGGYYGSKQGCKPYRFPPCEHNTVGGLQECDAYNTTPKCEWKCAVNSTIRYYDRMRLGGSVGPFPTKGKKPETQKRTRAIQIQKEISTKGPVTTSFIVYDDFIQYKSGIYKNTVGNMVGLHSVKLIGWGIEDGVEYWTVANSWNTDWGEQGYFKILRGDDHCGIEAYALKIRDN